MKKQNDAERERIMKTFFSNMDKALKEKGMNRHALKNKTGVSVERYKDCEGMREPSLSSAVKIADALGVSLDDLCGRNALVRDKEHLSAGECLELEVILEKNLSVAVDDEGQPLEPPRSNIDRIISAWNLHMREYARAKNFAPEKFPTSLYDERYNWIAEQIKKLKEENEQINFNVQEYDGEWDIATDADTHDEE